MKAIFLIGNIVLGVLLLMQVLTLTGTEGYAEIVYEGPIVFGDLFHIFEAAWLVVIVLFVLKHLKQGYLPAILVMLGIVSGFASYCNIPTVRQDRLIRKVVQASINIDGLERNRSEYKGDKEYYRHIIAEQKMFYSIFDQQSKFLASAKLIEDAKTIRVSIFFGILSGLLFLNAGRLYFLSRKNSDT